MTRLVFAVLALGALAACGADGAPERPTPGVAVTGDARVGVVLN
ncbi:argininosuccinate lyase [Pseudotabrizicola sp. 4114]|nr:putative small lipoprotein YifL [Pseudorhodobacter sp. 4114]